MACTAYPTVLNGKIVDNGTEFAEYECLSGFYMTGNKRITCNPNTGVWDDKPTCSVIDNSDKVTVYPDWWLFALIAILGLLVLLCLICIICYFCCGRGGNAVHPYQDHGDDGCCTCCGRSRKRDAHAYDVNGYNTVRTPSSGRDGIYFIPVKSSQVLTNYHRHSDVADSGAGYYGNTRTSATQTGRDGGIHTYTEKPSQGKEAGPLYYDGKKWVSSSNGVTRSNATQTANGGVVHHGSGSWNRGSRDSKTWKDAFNSETQYDDGDLYGTHKHPHTVQPSKPAKEVKAWMPHSKPLRTDHNTSTK